MLYLACFGSYGFKDLKGRNNFRGDCSKSPALTETIFMG